jgi:hypothetical protein
MGDKYIVFYGDEESHIHIGKIKIKMKGTYRYSDPNHEPTEFETSKMTPYVWLYPYDKKLYDRFKNVKDQDIIQLVFKKLKKDMLDRKQIQEKYG